VAPFLVAAAIGAASAWAGLDTPGTAGEATAVFVLTLLASLVAAGFVSSGVRTAQRRDLIGGLLLTASTYAATMAGHHDGPLTAGLAGVALLGLAHLSHGELDRSQQLPTPPGAWPWRVTLALVATCAVLDGLVALVSGGGRPRPGSPSVLSVLVACVVVTAVVTALTALAEGAGDDPSL